MNKAPDMEFAREVKAALGTDALTLAFAGDELEVFVPRSHLADALLLLRDTPRLAFAQLMDIAGVDFPSRPERFEIVYELLSLRWNKRLRVKIETDEASAVPSATLIYPNANWLEREVWDMFGVAFTGHPDLRRILSDYGFEGHPLRKDFPLTGYVEVRYDDEKACIVSEPVKLAQDYRAFDALSPWEDQRPLDEKGTS